MNQRPTRFVDFLAFVAFGVGGAIVGLGAISFGFQLLFMPVGLALILVAALRREPRLAGAFAGGSIAVAIASWLSYQLGLAETIFQPHLLLLVVLMSSLALLGYVAGRGIDRAARTRRAPSWPS